MTETARNVYLLPERLRSIIDESRTQAEQTVLDSVTVSVVKIGRVWNNT